LRERPLRFLFRAESYYGVDRHDYQFSIKGNEGHRFLVSDSRKLPFCSASFDAIFANACLEHIEGPELAIRECARILRPNGRIVLVVPTPWSMIYDELPFLLLSLLRRSGGHAHTYFSSTFVTTLLADAGFVDVKVQTSLGPAGSILKAGFIFALMPGWLWNRLMRKMFGASMRRGLNGSASTWNAVDLEDLKDRLTKDAPASLLHRIYRQLLRMAMAIDCNAGTSWASEIWVAARKA
jgi:SAM-dependent methyltransferase